MADPFGKGFGKNRLELPESLGSKTCVYPISVLAGGHPSTYSLQKPGHQGKKEPILRSL
jgi:hypothetical protein